MVLGLLVVIPIVFSFSVENVKGANYYPSKHPWEKMWVEWDKNLIDKELKLAEELGLNTVETYIQYPFFFSEESIKIRTNMVQKLDEFLNIANKHGLKVIYTLFDFVPSYSSSKWEFHKEYLEGIIKRFKNDKRIYLWGIRNEINLIDDVPDTIIVWAESVATFIRNYDTIHPLELELGGSDLKFLQNSATPFIKRLKNKIDVIDVSFYGEPDSLPSILLWLREQSSKPIMVSEFGYSTYLPQGEEKQKKYFKKVLNILKQTKTGFRFWTLYDFVDGKITNKEKSYGVIRSNYKPKDSYFLIKNVLKQ